MAPAPPLLKRVHPPRAPHAQRTSAAACARRSTRAIVFFSSCCSSAFSAASATRELGSGGEGVIEAAAVVRRREHCDAAGQEPLRVKSGRKGSVLRAPCLHATCLRAPHMLSRHRHFTTQPPAPALPGPPAKGPRERQRLAISCVSSTEMREIQST